MAATGLEKSINILLAKIIKAIRVFLSECAMKKMKTTLPFGSFGIIYSEVISRSLNYQLFRICRLWMNQILCMPESCNLFMKG